MSHALWRIGAARTPYLLPHWETILRVQVKCLHVSVPWFVHVKGHTCATIWYSHSNHVWASFWAEVRGTSLSLAVRPNNFLVSRLFLFLIVLSRGSYPFNPLWIPISLPWARILVDPSWVLYAQEHFWVFLGSRLLLNLLRPSIIIRTSYLSLDFSLVIITSRTLFVLPHVRKKSVGAKFSPCIIRTSYMWMLPNNVSSF